MHKKNNLFTMQGLYIYGNHTCKYKPFLYASVDTIILFVFLMKMN